MKSEYEPLAALLSFVRRVNPPQRASRLAPVSLNLLEQAVYLFLIRFNLFLNFE